MSKAESLHKQIMLENHQWIPFMIVGICLAMRTEAKGMTLESYFFVSI